MVVSASRLRRIPATSRVIALSKTGMLEQMHSSRRHDQLRLDRSHNRPACGSARSPPCCFCQRPPKQGPTGERVEWEPRQMATSTLMGSGVILKKWGRRPGRAPGVRLGAEAVAAAAGDHERRATRAGGAAGGTCSRRASSVRDPPRARDSSGVLRGKVAGDSAIREEVELYVLRKHEATFSGVQPEGRRRPVESSGREMSFAMVQTDCLMPVPRLNCEGE
jgi:hypothetical protein